jgi:phosphohistidine phosphatase
MKLYLVQHGDAVPKEVDPERPLSEQGRADVRGVAAFLARAGVRVSAIRHSGKKRAEQTAELLAAAVGGGARAARVSGIDPLDPVADFAQTADEWTQDTMVVGHLPFVGKLVSQLVVGDEAASTVSFRPGSVVCLEREPEGGWSVAWMIRPELMARPT